jgi:hypothetical protein
MQQTVAEAPRAGARARGQAGLLWTDYGFLLGIAIAALVTTDPLGWGLAGHALVKHLALLVALPATGLALLLRPAVPRARTADPVRPLAAPLAVAWPLALFALLAAGGGAYARFALGAGTTFLNYGLYVAMMFCAAAMVLQCDAPLALLRGYLAILLAAALAMSALLIAFAGVRQVYHEQIFLVIPMAALFFAGRAPALARWGAAAYFLLMAWFSHKYTSYLVAALSAGYLALFVWLPRLPRGDPLGRAAVIYWGALAFLAAGAAALAYSLRSGELPTGNVDFRMHTYGAAWERFLDSPLVGSWFAREAAEKFTLFDVGIAGNILPTHSDVLDLLANGGLLGFGLCAAGILAIAVLAWRRVLRPALIERPEARYAHTLALLSLAAILTCAFNPILLQPPMAALAWSNLGMLLGLSLRAAGPPGGRAGAP